RMHRPLERDRGDFAGELARVGSLDDQWPFAEHPTDILCVAVGRPFHLASAAVDVQPWSPERCERLKIGLRRVRTFEVVRPVARPGGKLIVQLPQPMLVPTGDSAGRGE